MLKNTHTSFGLSIMLIFVLVINIRYGIPFIPIVALSLLAILALFPDVDHPNGYLNKRIPILQPLSKIYGHRTWSHDVFSLLIVAFVIFRLFVILSGTIPAFITHDGVGMVKWIDFASYRQEYVIPLNIWARAKKIILITFKSYEFRGIYVALLSHIGGDFLTKGKMKIFFRARRICDKFGKGMIGKILTLPFQILVIIEDVVMNAKKPIVPKTGGTFELKVYATIFNLLNIIGLTYFVQVLMAYHTSVIEGTTNFPITTKKPFYVLAFFFVLSVWYLFQVNFKSMKEQGKVILKSILFLVVTSLSIGALFFVISYFHIPLEAMFAKVLLVLAICLIIYGTYLKTIKQPLEEFNVTLNETIYVLMALTCLVFLGIFYFKLSPIS